VRRTLSIGPGRHLHVFKSTVIQARQIILRPILQHQSIYPLTGLSLTFVANGPLLADEAVAGAGDRDHVVPLTKAPEGAEVDGLRQDQSVAIASPVGPVVDVPIGVDAVEGGAVPVPVVVGGGGAADIGVQVCANHMVATAAAGLGPDSDVDGSDGSDQGGEQMK